LSERKVDNEKGGAFTVLKVRLWGSVLIYEKPPNRLTSNSESCLFRNDEPRGLY